LAELVRLSQHARDDVRTAIATLKARADAGDDLAAVQAESDVTTACQHTPSS